MNCSDYSTAWICQKCGLLVSLGYDLEGEVPQAANLAESIRIRGPNGEYCRNCEASESSSVTLRNGTSLESIRHKLDNKMDVIAIPYVSNLSPLQESFLFLCLEGLWTHFHCNYYAIFRCFVTWSLSSWQWASSESLFTHYVRTENG